MTTAARRALEPEDVGIVPRHRRTDVEQRLPCQICKRGPSDTALALLLLEGGGWRAYCHRCRQRWGWSARPHPSRAPGASVRPHGLSPDAARRVPGATAARTDLAPQWRDYWLRRCVPIADTVGAQYLEHRACPLPPPDGHLRFDPAAWHWPSKTRSPALVALASGALDRGPMTLHFTFVRRDGIGKAALNPARLLLAGHGKAGAVVRLWPDEAVATGLGVAEGIESALSLAWAGLPVWACIDGGNLAAFPVLSGVESLAIAVDRDPAGEKAARELAHRWVTAGREVRLVMPKAGDLNDVATGAYVDD